ncbi:fimbria/pilus periplasmic chaperone [Stenotrophomonas sp. HMWF023]|uniref:fimbrial biogenesis chaperone n=1 Tax=Stenotrophomonas sp. HMWF023 TaxID=2056859 RepID=UPI0015E83708|nr:fimbria/pilus periplasmic chaperone [Stenotrophomonas sp. HMWF023]
MNTPTIRFLLACLMATPLLAKAGVQVGTTRVIYPTDAREVAVELVNRGTTPSLVQTWIDAGDPKSRPDNIEGVPFVVTPPITRIDGGMGQSLRVSYLGKDAPKDRESLYWINVLDIPASPKKGEDNATEGQLSANLQFAVRTRLKVFLRPKGLKGSPSESVKALTWQPSSHDGKPSVLVTNPTPYYVSVAFLTIPGTGRVNAGASVPPLGAMHIDLPSPLASGTPFVVRSINDYGGTVDTNVTP